MTAPNAAERRACWAARDRLWSCLDGRAPESCQACQSDFEEKCPAQWVKYFTKRRDFLKYKEKLHTDGFTPAEGPREST
ncbi:cytochrome c oxidase assembly factor 6 homolog [Xenentodon cancila]